MWAGRLLPTGIMGGGDVFIPKGRTGDEVKPTDSSWRQPFGATTGTHRIENTGQTRLYTLCNMVPNEDFAELIRSGTPVELDEEDLAVLRRLHQSYVRSRVGVG